MLCVLILNFSATRLAVVPDLYRSIMEAYTKLGDEFCDHVADLRGRQFLIMLSRGFA